MSNLILCPHTDDAIFSLGDYLVNNKGFTIAASFAGVPLDPAGNKKHTILRKEHDDACAVVDAKVINGDLLDDVYGKQNIEELTSWVLEVIKSYENVYIPLGIHHPDHVMLSDLLLSLIPSMPDKNFFVYAELPYWVLYPELFKQRLNLFEKDYKLDSINIDFTINKIDAIKCYDSQIDQNLIEKLIVKEYLWKIS
jgi:LmbE family N-acetylglucosaminyl deacetylase